MSELERALAVLRAGALVVIPTDTVYGVAAMPAIPGGIEAIFRAKGRSEDKALPILGATIESLAKVVVLDERARAVAERFWPGPLTLVLKRTVGFPYDLGGSDPETVAVRIPSSMVALELLRMSGPLAVTSANVSGEQPATSVEGARSALGNAVGVYLDGGPCSGSPSTVVSLVDEPIVLRAGGISETDIKEALA
jgi:tRNA threonylcarbamoyl adenosine modification protein (Sua5/YciO/YrdC/YwlC family)